MGSPALHRVLFGGPGHSPGPSSGYPCAEIGLSLSLSVWLVLRSSSSAPFSPLTKVGSRTPVSSRAPGRPLIAPHQVSLRRTAFSQIIFLSRVSGPLPKGRPSHHLAFGFSAPSPSVCTLPGLTPLTAPLRPALRFAPHLAWSRLPRQVFLICPLSPASRSSASPQPLLPSDTALLAIFFHPGARPSLKSERASGPHPPHSYRRQ